LPDIAAPAGAGQILQSAEHARVLEAAVLDAFTTEKPCRAKQDRPPGKDALAAAQRLSENAQGVVVDLEQPGAPDRRRAPPGARDVVDRRLNDAFALGPARRADPDLNAVVLGDLRELRGDPIGPGVEDGGHSVGPPGLGRSSQTAKDPVHALHQVGEAHSLADHPAALPRERQRADEHVGGRSPRCLCELEPVPPGLLAATERSARFVMRWKRASSQPPALAVVLPRVRPLRRPRVRCGHHRRRPLPLDRLFRRDSTRATLVLPLRQVPAATALPASHPRSDRDPRHSAGIPPTSYGYCLPRESVGWERATVRGRRGSASALHNNEPTPGHRTFR